LAGKNVRDLALRKDSGHSGTEMLKRNSGMTERYQLVSILISVSSGTYIRSIAHDLGRKLKTGAVVFSLERTRAGKFKKSL
jgi:tRNA U55 pseudouridine synthase TruB